MVPVRVPAHLAASAESAGGRVTEVPRCCTAEGFAEEGGCSTGVAISTLAAGTRLLVRTRRSDYRVVVLDGPRHRVLVQGGRLLPEAVEAVLQGSSLGGSFVKTGWIGVGLRLELILDRRRIVTSSVKSIEFDAVPPRHDGLPVSG